MRAISRSCLALVPLSFVLGAVACSGSSPDVPSIGHTSAAVTAPSTVVTAPADVVAGQRFAQSVSVDGDTAIAGMGGISGDSTPTHAYVYRKGATGWSLEQELASEGSFFGHAVAVKGDVAVVADGAVRAYFYTRSGTTWTKQTGIMVDEWAPLVAIDGGSVLTAGYLPATPYQRGSATIRVGSGATWTVQAKLDVPVANSFGYATAAVLRSDTAVVGYGGVPDATGSIAGAGTVFVYERSGTSWSHTASLYAKSAASYGGFGASIALSPDRSRLVVSSKNQVVTEIFERSGASWTRTATIAARGQVEADASSVYICDDLCQRYSQVNGTWTADVQLGGATGFALASSLSSMATYTPRGVALSGSTLVVGDWSANSSTGAVAFFDTGPAAPTSVTVACASSPCTSTDALTLTTAGAPTSSGAWVGLAESGSADSAYLAYKYTGGKTSGTYSFAARSAGTYVARVYDTGLNKVAESAPFTVTGPAPSALVVACTSSPCTQSDGVTVTFAGLPGYYYDWIALVPQGSPSRLYAQYAFTRGAPSGSVTFAAPPAGTTLVARAFVNNSYTQVGADSDPITIAASSTPAVVTSSCAAGCTTASAPTVTFASMPTNVRAWVSIAYAGSADTSIAQWSYTRGAASGAVAFAKLPAGSYVARAYADNGFTKVAESASFNVTP